MLDSHFQVSFRGDQNSRFRWNINSASTFCAHFRRDYSEDYIPKSDCLQLVANAEQYLSSIAARRLLTYEKIAEPGTARHGTGNVSNILDDFRFKFFTRDEKEREERRLQKIEIKRMGRIEAAKRGKIYVDKENP